MPANFLKKKKEKKKGAPKKDKIQPEPQNFTPRRELVFKTPTTKQEEEVIKEGKSDGGARIIFVPPQEYREIETFVKGQFGEIASPYLSLFVHKKGY